MPQWIHERARHLLAKNPNMSKSMAFGLATQQSHVMGKSPKNYGTDEGREKAKEKYDNPAEMTKTPNPGKLQTKKLAFVEALPTLTGLATGYGPGRSTAGETAAALAPKGKVHRSENIARNMAVVGAPLGGLVGMGLARRYGLAPRLGEFVAKNFPKGIIAEPAIEQELVHLGIPGVAAIGGSLLGGAATGALVGGAQQVRSHLGHHHKTAAEDSTAGRDATLGAGGAVAGQLAIAGAGLRAAHMAHKDSRLPGAEALFDKVRGTSPVPVVLTPDVNMGTYGHLVGDTTKQVFVDSHSPGILAHEVGHAGIDQNKWGRLLQNDFTQHLGVHAPLAGFVGGMATGNSDNPTVRRLGAASGLIASLPMLAFEAGASLKGHHNLKQLGASAEQLASARSALLPAFGSYVGRAGTALGAGMLGSGLARMKAQSDKQIAEYKASRKTAKQKGEKEDDEFGDETEPPTNKLADFSTNMYSGVMNPPPMVYASGIPPFQEPPVKTSGPPSERKTAEKQTDMAKEHVLRNALRGGIHGALSHQHEQKTAGFGEHLLRKIHDFSAPPDYVTAVSQASGIPEDHVRPYVFNIRPQRFMVPAEQFAQDLKPVWDIKENQYNPLQQGLLATGEGSPEEAAYLQQHKGKLDELYNGWVQGQLALRKKYTGGEKVAESLAELKELEHEGPDLQRYAKPVIGAIDDMKPILLRRLGVKSEDKEASIRSPQAQLQTAQTVGAPKLSTPPGPSIAQISKPVGYGRPISGAAKGNNTI